MHIARINSNTSRNPFGARSVSAVSGLLPERFNAVRSVHHVQDPHGLVGFGKKFELLSTKSIIYSTLAVGGIFWALLTNPMSCATKNDGNTWEQVVNEPSDRPKPDDLDVMEGRLPKQPEGKDPGNVVIITPETDTLGEAEEVYSLGGEEIGPENIIQTSTFETPPTPKPKPDPRKMADELGKKAARMTGEYRLRTKPISSWFKSQIDDITEAHYPKSDDPKLNALMLYLVRESLKIRLGEHDFKDDEIRYITIPPGEKVTLWRIKKLDEIMHHQNKWPNSRDGNGNLRCKQPPCDEFPEGGAYTNLKTVEVFNKEQIEAGGGVIGGDKGGKVNLDGCPPSAYKSQSPKK